MKRREKTPREHPAAEDGAEVRQPSAENEPPAQERYPLPSRVRELSDATTFLVIPFLSGICLKLEGG